MSKKDKRREALRLGKKDMSFAEIMQAIGACRADDCDKCLLNGGPIAGWFPEDVPDCYTVLLKNAAKQLRRTGNWWRWDDIFRVYRCPYCGRPEKPCFELWKKGGLKKSLPSRCTYCKGELEGVEGEENDH